MCWIYPNKWYLLNIGIQNFNIFFTTLCAIMFFLQTQQKALCTLPNVLSLNCQVENELDREFWKFQQTEREGGGWVPLSMEVTISDDKALNIIEYRHTRSNEHSAASSQKVVCFGEVHFRPAINVQSPLICADHICTPSTCLKQSLKSQNFMEVATMQMTCKYMYKFRV